MEKEPGYKVEISGDDTEEVPDLLPVPQNAYEGTEKELQKENSLNPRPSDITFPKSQLSSTQMPQKTMQSATVNTVDSKINHVASLDYWNSVPATTNAMLAMLGSYPWYSRIDLQGSKIFTAKVRRLLLDLPPGEKFKKGLDCGAGIGRVTEGFLSHVCEVIDVIEPVEKFTQVMRDSALRKNGVIGDIYTVGLEEWYPERTYDIIWTQWCVGHLTDSQLVEYIARCRASLTETGVMVVKENLSTDPLGIDMYDDLDSSVTRTDSKFKQLFDEAGMVLIKSEIQRGFPKEYKLLPVKSYALRAKS